MKEVESKKDKLRISEQVMIREFNATLKYFGKSDYEKSRTRESFHEIKDKYNSYLTWAQMGIITSRDAILKFLSITARMNDVELIKKVACIFDPKIFDSFFLREVVSVHCVFVRKRNEFDIIDAIKFLIPISDVDACNSSALHISVSKVNLEVFNLLLPKSNPKALSSITCRSAFVGYARHLLASKDKDVGGNAKDLLLKASEVSLQMAQILLPLSDIKELKFYLSRGSSASSELDKIKSQAFDKSLELYAHIEADIIRGKIKEEAKSLNITLDDSTPKRKFI